MRTMTPIAKLGLAGIVGLLGWFAAPATPALAHDRDHDRYRGHHDRDHDHDRQYQGRHGGYREGWGRPVIDVQVAHPVVAPRQVWIPGSWGWHAHRRLWVEGRWAMPPQPNLIWVAAQWVWDDRAGQWVWSEGHWAPGAY